MITFDIEEILIANENSDKSQELVWEIMDLAETQKLPLIFKISG